jgi:hypothetical protein
MKLHSLKVVGVAAVLSVASCASRSAVKSVAQQSTKLAAPAENYPVITRIISRHQTVTISAGPTSPLYSVQSPDGKMLVAYATLEQLRQQHPEHFRMIEPLVAVDTAVVSAASVD